jgi:hypothetical protein
MSMEVEYPKKAPNKLVKKTEEVITLIESGEIKPRKTTRVGYMVVDLGRCERLVLSEDRERARVFNKYSEFERFINKKH